MGKRTSGFVKNAALIVGVFVAFKVLQNRNLIPTASGLNQSVGNLFKNPFSDGGPPETAPAPPGGGTESPFTSPGAIPEPTGGESSGGSLNIGSIFKQSGFSGILDSFGSPSGTFNLFKSPFSVPNIRPSLNLSVFGTSGLESQGLSIRNTRIAPGAISLKVPTIVGSFSTPTGGTRTIRGSPALFERLRQNLGT